MAPTTIQMLRNAHLIDRDDSIPTSIPQAPPAAGSWGPPAAQGWSPSAIIGIVAAIVIILVLVPLIAIILRRYERKRCLEMLPDAAAGGLDSSKSSVREDQSLKSILVTKEVSRSSLRMAPGLSKPEEAHTHGRGWSQTEVRGGDWR
jgi:flagellar biosynthesis/type III secretory pathway M-ring protein FliF/YscJ